MMLPCPCLKALPSIGLLSIATTSQAFTGGGVPRRISAALHAWKPCAQPRFDAFAECTVGPWIAPSSSEQQEVEEVMRSCGGAVQGIRELPLSLIRLTDASEERTYHNRADGGFVFADDGTYSAGPERWEWKASNDDDGSAEKLTMASLAFSARRRVWITSKLSEAREAVESSAPGQSAQMEPRVLQLARPGSTVLSAQDSNDTVEIISSELPDVNWRTIQRVRMPSSNQPWSLARAKWEKQVDDESSLGGDESVAEGPLMGWAYAEFISGDMKNNDLFGDVIAGDDAVMLNTLAVCPESRAARSAVRCYGADGMLKSVAFLDGSVV